jgi:dihydroorotate dehydrogenase electron transfer subunit
MTDSASSDCFPDKALFRAVLVESNEPIARDTFRLRILCPELAARIVPGQFVMLRLAGWDDPLLGRPLALYDTVVDQREAPRGLDLVYLVVGKMTARLAQYRPGQKLEIWGPLGNGFPARRTEHLVLVAGGIGQTPFLALAREYLGLRRYAGRAGASAQRVTLCYGVRSRDLLAGVADFQTLGIDVRLSTDDGTAGRAGLVTEVLSEVLAESSLPCSVLCCGPEPMMKAVAAIAAARNIPCLVSLESPMACGLGICFSCVVRVRQPDGGWDYRRTCVEGPVFDANDIEF